MNNLCNISFDDFPNYVLKSLLFIR